MGKTIAKEYEIKYLVCWEIDGKKYYNDQYTYDSSSNALKPNNSNLSEVPCNGKFDETNVVSIDGYIYETGDPIIFYENKKRIEMTVNVDGQSIISRDGSFERFLYADIGDNDSIAPPEGKEKRVIAPEQINGLGKDSPGADETGKDSPGADETGKDGPGADETGKDGDGKKPKPSDTTVPTEKSADELAKEAWSSVDFNNSAYSEIVQKIVGSSGKTKEDVIKELNEAAKKGPNEIYSYLKNSQIKDEDLTAAFAAAYANPAKIEWPPGCGGLTDEIKDFLKSLSELPENPSVDPSTLKKDKNGFKAVHYEYWDLGTNNGKKSAEFSQNAKTVLESVDKITSMLNDKSTIWKGTGKTEAEKFAKELKDEASELYQAVQLLKEVANDVDKMAMLSKKMMEEQALQEYYEAERDKAQKALDALVRAEPSKTITDSDGTERPNPAHAAWEAAKKALEAKRDDLEAKRKEHYDLAVAADKEIEKYEKAVETVQNAVKKVNDANTGKKKDNNNGNNRNNNGGNNSGGGGGGGSGTGGSGSKKTTPETTPPPSGEDNTQKQMEYYKKLSFEQLSLISEYLAKLATANNTTVEALMTDAQFSGILASTLASVTEIPKELADLIGSGDAAATQQLIYQIYTGQQPEVMALNDYTKSSIYTYLSGVATDNNVSLSDLITKEQYDNTVKSALANYGNVVKTLSGLTDTALTEKVTNIYDGNGIENLSEGEVNIIRDYAEIMSIKNDISADEYLTKSELPANYRELGKTSVFANTLNVFGFEKVKTILLSIFTS